ncbi:hypothetical protein [Thalassoroseus pseudoceratinae]|uniref:hypothetical protein n=1 Tax=Thalassoroseus pseudoceratinae TaxID=2713176 RepID=UPI00142259E5|nr:hypothetical protein [Thalassoroseus pseudoceratinae]
MRVPPVSQNSVRFIEYLRDHRWNSLDSGIVEKRRPYHSVDETAATIKAGMLFRLRL